MSENDLGDDFESYAHFIIEPTRGMGGVPEGFSPLQKQPYCIMNSTIKDYLLIGWETDKLPKCKNCKRIEWQKSQERTSSAFGDPELWFKHVGIASLQTELQAFHADGSTQGLLATVEQTISALKEQYGEPVCDGTQFWKLWTKRRRELYVLKQACKCGETEFSIELTFGEISEIYNAIQKELKLQK